MKARIWTGLIVAVLLIGAAGFLAPSGAQDQTTQRLDNLETRVAALETQVATLEPSSPPAAMTYTIAGTLQIMDGTKYRMVPRTEGCIGLEEYGDIYPGADVRVVNESGSLLALGKLAGKPNDRTVCRFTFSLKVPKARYYTFSVGTAARKPITISYDQMVAAHWKVALSLG